jgi:hypothetical protein
MNSDIAFLCPSPRNIIREEEELDGALVEWTSNGCHSQEGLIVEVPENDKVPWETRSDRRN